MNIPLAAVLGIAFYVAESWLGWRRHSSREGGGRSADGSSMRMLWIVAMASIGAGLLVTSLQVGPHFPAWFPWRAASVTVFVLGVAVRWWAIIHLGRFFTVDIHVAHGHRVIADGPYRAVRHPSYTGLLMQYAGWALALNNVVALPVVLVPVFISLWHRMRDEEAALSGALGDDYSAYCRRTKRLMPLVY